MRLARWWHAGGRARGNRKYEPRQVSTRQIDTFNAPPVPSKGNCTNGRAKIVCVPPPPGTRIFKIGRLEE